MPTSGLGSATSAEVVSYEAIRAAWLQLQMPYAPGASETVSAETQSCLWRNSGSPALIGRAVILTESNSTPRKEILCAGESLLFSQLTRSPNWLRCRSTRSLWSHNCSRARDSWGSWCPLPVTGQGRPPRPSWRHGGTGRARRGGPCTAMPDPRTQTVGTVCVVEGSKHESKHPSGRSLQTNPGAVCIWSCACASTSWTGACAGLGSGVANPGLVEDHRLSWVRWNKGCKTPASSRLEGPARLHPLPGGQQSPRARQERSELPTQSRVRRWTWEVAWRTESRSRVELYAWANETGWAAQATPPDAVQVAPTAQSAQRHKNSMVVGKLKKKVLVLHCRFFWSA